MIPSATSHLKGLHVLAVDDEVDTLETVTDAGGRFRFEGLDADAGLDYWPEAVTWT